jgi:transglutaminase-like putative cysteine protease
MTERPPDFARLGWATGALLLSVAPHLPRIPAWVTLLTIICMGWRLAAAAQGWAEPMRALRLVIAAIAFGGVVVSYGTINGVEAGSALLIVMMNMKLLETWRRRDFQVLMFISYFLVLAQLLFEPGMWTLPWMVCAVWLSTTALMQSVRVNSPLPTAKAARLVGKMLVLSLPVMAALFVLFPRVPGPFWAMPTRSGSATSGLTEEMSPGAINSLSLSNAVAFRVSFRNVVPTPGQRYWRGPVLHHFDGVTWSEPGRIPSQTINIRPAGRPIDYRITMEASDRPWLLALDFPSSWTAPRSFLSFDFQLLSRRPVDQLSTYDVVSYPDAIAEPEILQRARRWDLQLPDERNPKTIALAAELRARYSNDRQLIDTVLAHFTNEEFVYTLRPPALASANPVDDFLFDTRRGFCEHFASAFTTLMRAAGIPARVVTGYQGGELNWVDQRMTVRQSDAHAWSEVWLPGEGWTRVDPTAAVAPNRIELGLAGALPDSDLVPGRFLRSLPVLESLRQRWNAMDAGWNEWILGYSSDQQMEVLRFIGISNPDWQQLTAVMGIVLAVLLAGLTAWFAWQYRPPRREEARRLYDLFVRKLAKKQLDRHPAEGPLDFARRAEAQYPEFGPGIRNVTRSYVRLRYESAADPEELRRLRTLVRSFKAR